MDEGQLNAVKLACLIFAILDFLLMIGLAVFCYKSKKNRAKEAKRQPEITFGEIGVVHKFNLKCRESDMKLIRDLS